MISEWDMLSDELQLALSRAALSRAAAELADRAYAMAQEIEVGQITDRGGAEALRLFAAILRIPGTIGFGTMGNA